MPKQTETFARTLIDALINDRHWQTVTVPIGKPPQTIDIQEKHHA